MVARRCVFLDRDGVINVKRPEGEYVRSWSEFELIPEIVDDIRLFNALGYLVIVVTNQRGVANGVMSLSDVADVHRRMVELLAERGARIDDVFACPHEKNTCECRKPKPGLVLAAKEKWNIDLAGSIMIGDSDCDRDLAVACDLPFVRMLHGRITSITTK